MNKKKILVTGSGGFIFSNFVRFVLKNKLPYNVVSIDKCTNPKLLNTIYSNKGHQFYIADVCDQHIVNTIFELEKPDFVIHGAAQSFVDSSIINADDFVTTNVFGTQSIINTCLKHKVEKLVYISTDEVYGHLKSEDESPWTESSPINPRNPYSASKAAGELMVMAAGQTHGLRYNITRSCNNYGPRQPNRNLIPKTIANIINQTQVPIYDQGMQIRDWIHVQDNCSAIMAVLENGLDKEIYNISSKQEFTNIEVFYEISKIFKKEYDIDASQLLTFVKDRPGHDFRYSISNDKIKALGWVPQWTFKGGGIKETIAWYVANKWFLK